MRYAALADPFRIVPSPESAPDEERGALGLSAGSRYRIAFAGVFALAGRLAFLGISASSATAALFIDSGMLC